MVYTTQNHWVRGLCPSSGILINLKTQRFGKLDIFPFSDEEINYNFHSYRSYTIHVSPPFFTA
jgi:hypothetical protein